LRPEESAITSLILIITLPNCLGEDLQPSYGSRAHGAGWIRSNRRQNDRRRRTTGDAQDTRR
jgi:hypothetical protein